MLDNPVKPRRELPNLSWGRMVGSRRKARRCRADRDRMVDTLANDAAYKACLVMSPDETRRQHDIAVLAAFGLLDPNDLLPAVDMLDLQPDHLAERLRISAGSSCTWPRLA
jgi:hypothetical protein